MMNAKVSVIVPMYGVAPFIERCAESLLSQTLHEVELLFVNDATKDESVEVLQRVLARYPERNVQVLHHAVNQGLPAARNTGLAVATGEFVFHCDGDDYVEPDMLQRLYDHAVATGSDIVWCDWYLTYPQRERYMRQPQFDDPQAALRAMLGGAMKFNVWNKLARRSLYVDNGITFPTGYGMGEDMTMMMLFAYARKVSYLPQAFYHYVKYNTEAFSQTYSPQHLEQLQHNVDRIATFVAAHYGDAMAQEVAFLKLEAKFPFLISNGSGGKYRRWQAWYPEANRYIMANKNISLRSRMVQWCASKGLWFVVWAYYYGVIRLVYGVIYK